MVEAITELLDKNMQIEILIALTLSLVSSVATAALTATTTRGAPFTFDVIKGSHLNVKLVSMPLLEVIRAFEKIAQQKRGEFETTSQFEERRAKLATRHLLGSLAPNSLMAFSLPGETNRKIEYSYDADGGKATVALPMREIRANGIRRGKDSEYREDLINAFDHSTTLISSRSYLAANAYGARAKVTDDSYNKFGIAFPLTDLNVTRRGSASDRPSTTFAISPEKAKKELPHLRIALIVRPKSPYVVYDAVSTEATVANPEAASFYKLYLLTDFHGAVFYSGLTGEIFARMPDQLGREQSGLGSPAE